MCSVCEFSQANGFYHCKRGGRFTASLAFQGKIYKLTIETLDFLATLDLERIDEEGKKYYLRMELKRSSPKWSHVPVNQVCSTHSSDQSRFPIQVSYLNINTENLAIGFNLL